jgi:hypothetical protein
MHQRWPVRERSEIAKDLGEHFRPFREISYSPEGTRSNLRVSEDSILKRLDEKGL